jgi:ribonuclease HII
MRIAGVDEAGRGCVIGPLVIAGVLVDEEAQAKLQEISVKDSKLLSLLTREKLYSQIRRIAERVISLSVSPVEIDRVVFAGVKFRRLNWLEAQKMAKIIDMLNPELVYVDAPDVFEDRFKQQILKNSRLKPTVIAEHHADRTYPAVSAASIIAKVERDHAIAKLKKKFGNFGSGYPSDPATIRFLQEYTKTEMLPNIVRRSWKTVKKLRTRS